MGDLTPAQRNQRRQGPLRHGARSEAQVGRVARAQKRRFLRQVGLRATDLDGLGRAYLDNWARAQRQVELMDSWVAERGWLDEEGNPPGFTKTYFAALNSASPLAS